MARSHGKIKVGIWVDEDWLDLERPEQWTYFMLLSQPLLSLVGCIDYRPNRWQGLAQGLTQDAVEASVTRLEHAGFVCVDRGTEELLVRSMTRHDGLRTGNLKLAKGFWAAWGSIASRPLRKVAVDNMPQEMIDHDECPEPARQLRSFPPIEWVPERAIAQPIGEPIGKSIGQAIEEPIAPPSAFRLPPSANARSADRSTPAVDNVDPPSATPPCDFKHHPVPRLAEDQRRDLLANVRSLNTRRAN